MISKITGFALTFPLLAGFLLPSVWFHQTAQQEPSIRLSFIGEKQLSNHLVINKTLVGGLSGLDYDPKTNHWIFISDDRSEHGPSRFYTGSIHFKNNRLHSVTLVHVIPLKQPNGQLYPNRTEYNNGATGAVPDFESIRFDPLTHHIWYTSEGDRHLNLNPFIRASDGQGRFVASLNLPEYYKNTSNETGQRNNLGPEGTAFTPSGDYYFVMMEAPLLQDSSLQENQNEGLNRILKYNRLGQLEAEYAYPINLKATNHYPTGGARNGVSEILAINRHRLLVLERASEKINENQEKNLIRIFQIDTETATNIKGVHSLKNATNVTPLSKILVLNLGNIEGLSRVDNIEGMAWGPKLSNGDPSLVLISDNNFNPSQVTEIIAFDVKGLTPGASS